MMKLFSRVCRSPMSVPWRPLPQLKTWKYRGLLVRYCYSFETFFFILSALRRFPKKARVMIGFSFRV